MRSGSRWESSPHARHFGNYSGTYSGKAHIGRCLSLYDCVLLKEMTGRGSMSDTYEAIDPKYKVSELSRSDSAEVKVEGEFNITAGEGRFTISISRRD